MKTILCVDDIEANLFTLRSILEQKKELYNVVTVSSGEAALGVLLRQKIDMLLLDVMMPEMDGFETAKLILGNKKTKNIPIIFITAKKDDETIKKCYASGGVDYLNKPYSEVELFARISFHLELVEQYEKLKKERDFIQSILDTQESILLVTNAKEVIKVNKRLLSFFHTATLGEFVEKYQCICKQFEAEEGCFHLGLVPKGVFWIDYLQEALQNSQQIVALKDADTNSINFFSIDVKVLSGYYLIALSDITELNEESKAFKYTASHDSLTGVYNRQYLNMVLESKLQQKDKFALMIVDIDHFKNINDTFGHLVGDEILKTLTKEIETKVRRKDIFARWGGEEFVIILDNVSEMNIAKNIAESIREHILQKKFEKVDTVTCSFGITVSKENDTIASIIKRADSALYEAKEKGRNRVCGVI